MGSQGIAVGDSDLLAVNDLAGSSDNMDNAKARKNGASSSMDGTAGYNEMKVDSYAFGILLYSLWTRREPYFGMNAFHVMTAVLLHDIRPDHSRLEFPPKLYRLMTACWARDPAHRPTFDVIKKQLSSPNIIAQP